MITIYKSIFIFSLVSILLVSCKDETNPTEDQHDHFEPIGIILYNNGQIQFKVSEGVIDTTISSNLKLPAGTYTDFTITFISGDGDEVQMPDDPDKELSWSIADAAYLEVKKHADYSNKLTMKGLQAGGTELEIHILHNGHIDFRTPKIPVVIE